MIGQITRLVGRCAIFAALAIGPLSDDASAQEAEDEVVRIGIVTFLSGPAAGPFGVPSANAAQLIADSMNAGTLPAPYDTVGINGLRVELMITDEAGGVSKQVTEFRNLVQRQNVDAVVGYVSSGSCLGIAPVAEEMKILTVLFDCGTPRIFEENDYRYVFRTAAHATMDSVGLAHYLLDLDPALGAIAGINQNYAWGHDSWRDFTLSMAALRPNAEIKTELFPKLFAGNFNAEISALLLSGAGAVHSSLWGGDLESFVLQATARGLPARTRLALTTGENIMDLLGEQLPHGVIIGGRGPYGAFAPDTPANRWFRDAITEAFGRPPTFPSYHMAQALLALKTAYEKAGAKGRADVEVVADAFEYLEFDGFGGPVRMALGNGHQAITDTAYGLYTFDANTGQARVTNVIRYAADCVNPPPGATSVEWIESGMPGANCAEIVAE